MILLYNNNKNCFPLCPVSDGISQYCLFFIPPLSPPSTSGPLWTPLESLFKCIFGGLQSSVSLILPQSFIHFQEKKKQCPRVCGKNSWAVNQMIIYSKTQALFCFCFFSNKKIQHQLTQQMKQIVLCWFHHAFFFLVFSVLFLCIHMSVCISAVL